MNSVDVLEAAVAAYVHAIEGQADGRDTDALTVARNAMIKAFGVSLHDPCVRVDLASVLNPARLAIDTWRSRAVEDWSVRDASFEDGQIDALYTLIAADPVQSLGMEVVRLADDPVAMRILRTVEAHGEALSAFVSEATRVPEVQFSDALADLARLTVIHRVAAGKGTLLSLGVNGTTLLELIRVGYVYGPGAS